ncbi:hypothetical protein, conserved [Eimeria tenella]|uniref:WIBG Mago-binding domain-containing protein n=1 Tax=Eimeria tenella TaxID=5802 RepID=U6KTA5_EIMTE|nr:hypothetical protein, conserved [Eimeria tenella]CDJ41196.1 hypothetical protein, conserved [Eimeria tenella]|eukprot:XP_013231946.1 hypothetical protein, conserved [Eimeria tenella]
MAGRGFGEAVEVGDSSSSSGPVVTEQTAGGQTYLTNLTTGHRLIPASRRPDGTLRRPIKVRPGYTPLEEMKSYKTRHQLSQEQHRATTGAAIPGLTAAAADSSSSNSSSSSSSRSRQRKKKQGNSPADSAATPAAFPVAPAAAASSSAAAAAAAAACCEQLTNLSISNKEANASRDPAKRLRNLKKKLNEIEELQQRKANGEVLLPEQEEKIERKQQLQQQAAELEAEIAAAA